MALNFASLSLRTKLILLNLAVAVPVILIVTLYVFPLMRTEIRSGKEELTRSSVETAISLMRNQYDRAKSGEIKEDEAKKLALEGVKGLRYGGNEYFWVHDVNLKMVMHPIKPELVGKDVGEMKDKAGKAFFKEMTELCLAKGGGFVDYMWSKPGSEQSVPKISYVQLFKEWNYIVGNGVYADEVEAIIVAFERKVLVSLGFVFVLSMIVSLIVSTRVAGLITKIVSGLNTTSVEIAQASGKLALAGTSLSNQVSESAASLEETVASISQVSSMVEKNSSNAREAAGLSDEGRQVAERGAQEIGELINSMRDISVSSKKIEDIIGIIDDIAFQTNLLALNAAVEAARAGEQGRGFAVVAEAVRTLATRSSVAAKDITQLIRTTSTQVGHGRRAVDQSGASLKDILGLSERIANLVMDIAREGEEQNRAIQQISIALNHLDQVTQSNAESSEAVAMSSRGMSTYADGMQILMREMEETILGDSKVSIESKFAA
jgi:methyl-accepting chemotaxis protein